MNSFTKSYIIIISLTLCLTTFLGFWALEKDNCLKVHISNKEGNIEVGHCQK